MPRIRRMLWWPCAILAAFLIVVTSTELAAAAAAPYVRHLAAVVPLTTDSNSVAQIKLSPIFIAVILSQVIPFITGWLTTHKTPSWAKGLITYGLNAVTSIVAAATTVGGSYVFTKETLITAVGAMGLSHAVYASVLKKAGLTSSTVIDAAGTEVKGVLANVGIKSTDPIVPPTPPTGG